MAQQRLLEAGDVGDVENANVPSLNDVYSDQAGPGCRYGLVHERAADAAHAYALHVTSARDHPQLCEANDVRHSS